MHFGVQAHKMVMDSPPRWALISFKNNEMPKHSIETLTKDVDRRFKAVNQRLDIMQPQVAEMHDFIIDYKGFERGRASYNKDGSIKISPDVWALIIKLVTIIGSLIVAIEGFKAYLK